MTDTLKTVQAQLDEAIVHLRSINAVLEGVLNPETLYSRTGDIKDINTMLVNRGELPALIAQMQRDAVQPVATELIAVLVSELRRHRYCGDTYPENGWPEVNAALAAYEKWKRAAPHPEAQALDSQLQPPDDVGGLEYRGNSVSFIHSKMTAYRTAIDEAWAAMRECGHPPDGKTRLADAIRALAAQQQDDHAGSPAPSRVDLPARVVDTVAASVGLSGPFDQDFYDFAQALMMEVLARVPAPSEPVASMVYFRREGSGTEDRLLVVGEPQKQVRAELITRVVPLYTHPAPSAQSSKAALSDEDARLSEDDLHARSWWCPTCKKDVPPEMVTKDGEHYLEAGGCGYAVRGELIEDQPKQPLSDDDIHRIWMETPERPTLAEEVLAFGHTLLARAGITRKPLTEDAICEMRRAARNDPRCVDQHWFVLLVRAVEQHHGITPQAGKESGDGTR